MINIVAHIIAKPGKRPEILAAFRAYRPTVMTEEGCVEYTPLIDTEGISRKIQAPIGDDTLMVIEKWSSLDTLRLHGAAPSTAAFTAQIDELAVSRTIHILSPV